MKRSLLIIAFFLLLGAVVNVAVAWTVAWTFSEAHSSQVAFDNRSRGDVSLEQHTALFVQWFWTHAEGLRP